MRYVLGMTLSVVVCAVAVWIYATIQISKGREFCFDKGHEYATAYVGGEVACIETTNGTRRVTKYRRK